MGVKAGIRLLNDPKILVPVGLTPKLLRTLLVLALVTLVNAAQAAPDTLWILAAGDLRGEVKPCGCTPGEELGGLARRLTYLDQRRQAYGDHLLSVDLGNNFPSPSAQGALKADLIVAVLGQAHLDAVLPGPGELALGVKALDRSLPYVLSNAADPAPLSSIRVVERGGQRIGILGYLSPEETFQGMQSDLRLDWPGEALLSKWRSLLLEHRVQVAVLLFRGSNGYLTPLVESRLFDAVITGNPSADESQQVTQRALGKSIVPQVPTKGQGVLRWPLAGGNTSPVVSVDWLDGTYADHSLVANAMAAYDARVKSLFLQQAAEAEAHRAASPYAGAQACKACHPKAYAVWQRSRHANALPSLQQVGKAFDPDCLACHVAGLGKNGYISQELTPGLAGVQCENCHGPARAHAAQPALKPTRPAIADQNGQTTLVCNGCHHGSHSPRFSFPVYWPKVQHR